MATTFPGFSRKALTFFRELEKNNDRVWFAAHKELFEQQVRGPMVELVGLLSGSFARIAADYVPERPEKAIYRIYRDTRFSKDKTPYKTHMGAIFQHRRIEKNRGAGFYFEISHQAVGIAGGIYMPGPEEQLAVRTAIEKDYTRFEKICTDSRLKKRFGEIQGESAARVPKGFAADSLAAKWLKRKQLYFYTELEAKLAMSPKLPSELMAYFTPMMPFVSFINDAILESLGDEETPVKRPEPMF